MKFRIKQTTLTDGSKVTDVNLFPNDQEQYTLKQMCIFSCTSENDANSFVWELEKLIQRFTVEELEEI